MTNDFELLISDSPMYQTKTLTAIWTENSVKKHIDYTVSDYAWHWHFEYAKMQIRREFASAMNPNFGAMKQCLLHLDQLFGESEYDAYEDLYMATSYEPVKYTDPYKLSPASQAVFDTYASGSVGGKYFHQGGYVSPAPNYTWKSNSTERELNDASLNLPGIMEKVKYPCKNNCTGKCVMLQGQYNTLRDTIMVLNDRCKWSREEIADWIEQLDIDTTFKVS